MGPVVGFRAAVAADVDTAWGIVLQAKRRMAAQGRSQWADGYPARSDIVRDVERGYGYLLSCDGVAAAYGAVCFDGEPAYGAIAGRWSLETPYAVLHRLAVADAMQGRGLGAAFFGAVEGLCRERGVLNFRVDTADENTAMRRLLDACGFAYCGEVLYEGCKRRMAFDKILK